MGLSATQTYGRTKMFKERLATIFSTAIMIHLDHDAMLAQRESLVFSDKRYKELPTHAKEYLRGYYDAKFDELFRTYLEWRHYVPAHKDFLSEPHLLTREQVRDLQTAGWEDIYQVINQANPTKGMKSTFTWKGHPDKPFLSNYVEGQAD